MKRWVFLFCFTGCLLLSPAFRIFATEPAGDQKTEAESHISAEDQKVIALMELLQNLEMLQDFDVIVTEEENK
jgi:hypothetical protein